MFSASLWGSHSLPSHPDQAGYRVSSSIRVQTLQVPSAGTGNGKCHQNHVLSLSRGSVVLLYRQGSLDWIHSSS